MTGFRSLIIGVLIVPIVPAAAQLTNGEVYDFQVGDVFQKRYSSSNAFGTNPPNIVTDTIVEVAWSQDLDTVFYIMNRTSYYMGSVQPSVQAIFYTNLLLPAQHWGGVQTCTPADDSAYVSEEYCDRLVWEKFNSDMDTCFESPGYFSQLISGCGGPYYWTMVSDNAGEGFEHELLYYRKGEEECGEFQSIPTGLLELHASQAYLYPNPTHGELLSNEVYRTVRVMDLQGRMLKQVSWPAMPDLSLFSNGPYILELVTLDDRTLVQRMLKY